FIGHSSHAPSWSSERRHRGSRDRSAGGVIPNHRIVQLFIAVNSILFDIDPHLGLAWLKLSIAVSIQPVKQRISKRHRHFISILIHRHLIGSPSGHKVRLAFYAGDVKKTKEQI